MDAKHYLDEGAISRWVQVAVIAAAGRDMRLRDDALCAANVHLSCLVREALERSALEAEIEHRAVETGSHAHPSETVRVEVDHVLRIVPQLLLDF